MASVTFEVTDDLARKILGLVESGRPSEITFCMRARVVIEVRAEDVWTNDLWAPRSFSCLTGGPPRA